MFTYFSHRQGRSFDIRVESNWNCVPWKQVVLAAVLDLKSKPVIPTASWQGVRH